MFFKKYSWIFIFILISCFDKNFVIKKQYLLPNIDSLINSQVKFLSNKRVIKKVILNGKEEILLLKTDTTFWKSELSIFSNLEINKPSLIGAYNKVRKKNVLIFNRKKGEKKSAIQVIINTSQNGDILSISGILLEKNYLYLSEQKLSMVFDKNSKLLKSYKFSGYQKLITRDTVFFEINGELTGRYEKN